MKRLVLFYLVLIAFPENVFAQESGVDSGTKPVLYRNSVYAELGGNGLVGSINYERIVKTGSNYRIALRAGGSYFSLAGSDYKSYSFNEFSVLAPFEATVITGQKNLTFETGFGITFAYNVDAQYDAGTQEYKSEVNTMVLPAFRIGGRWQPVNKPYFVRLGVVIMVDELQYYVPASIFPWPGIGFGYSFN